VRPRRNDEPGQGPHHAPGHQRIESIFWTAKDIFTFERHGARTLHALRTRLVSRFAAMAAAIALDAPIRQTTTRHGRPTTPKTRGTTRL
jgi:hypothetical protein